MSKEPTTRKSLMVSQPTHRRAKILAVSLDRQLEDVIEDALSLGLGQMEKANRFTRGAVKR